MRRRPNILKLAAWVFGIATVPVGAQTIYPGADGTLADGGGFGPYDGTADNADWFFNQSSYEGSVTLARSPVPLEQRVVWEFNLAAVTAPVPMTAKLTFTLRGAARFPAAPAVVEVYAYPSDLLETLADFSAPPLALVAVESVAPFQPATTYVVNVSSVVNERMAAGVRRVAFRFQIDADSPEDSNQAFFDTVDSDPATKPFLTITNRMPCDYDNDRDVDLDDYAQLSVCLRGPEVTVSTSCRVFDDDLDADVDAWDFSVFMDRLTAGG